MMRRRLGVLIWIVVFGVAFGLVEATVVDYLRGLLQIDGGYRLIGYTTLLNLGFIEFGRLHQPLFSSYTRPEMTREAATIVMLVAVAMLAARTWRQRIGAFLAAFATWDLAYYVFLHLLAGWPTSLLNQDIYFLLPVVWTGPVITPLVSSLVAGVGGAYLYLSGANHPLAGRRHAFKRL